MGGRQMSERGQAQVRGGDEVPARSEATGGQLGVLRKAAHGLHKRVGSPMLHACDHPLEVRL